MLQVNLYVATSVLALLFSTNAFSAGVGKLDVETKNDTFTNDGEIVGTQTVAGGVGFQAVGQRVISPALTYSLKYRSSNNTYTNNGTIKGRQTVAGGVANQAVGQDVIQ
jgi:hypothetical protein